MGIIKRNWPGEEGCRDLNAKIGFLISNNELILKRLSIVVCHMQSGSEQYTTYVHNLALLNIVIYNPATK